MAAYTKFESFVEGQWNDKIDWNSDVFKVALTLVAPDAAGDVLLADITQIAAGNGYPSGGNPTTISTSRSGGTLTVRGTEVTTTAAGGSIGPARYAVLYDDTVAGKPLVAFWDNGSSFTLNDGQSCVARFGGASPGVIHTAA